MPTSSVRAAKDLRRLPRNWTVDGNQHEPGATFDLRERTRTAARRITHHTPAEISWTRLRRWMLRARRALAGGWGLVGREGDDRMNRNDRRDGRDGGDSQGSGCCRRQRIIGNLLLSFQKLRVVYDITFRLPLSFWPGEIARSTR